MRSFSDLGAPEHEHPNRRPISTAFVAVEGRGPDAREGNYTARTTDAAPVASRPAANPNPPPVSMVWARQDRRQAEQRATAAEPVVADVAQNERVALNRKIGAGFFGR